MAQPQLLDTSAPRLVPYSRPWHIAKIILRAISFLLCLIVFIIAIISNALGDTAWRGYDWTWMSATPPAILTALYDIASLLVVCVRRSKRRGIHPGVDVGADLIICLSCLTGAAATPAVAVDVNSSRGMKGSDITMMIFLYIIALVHVVLFGRACRETRQRNKSRSSQSVYYIPGGGQPFVVLQQPSPVPAVPKPAVVPDRVEVMQEADLPSYAHDPALEEMDLSSSHESIQKEIIPSDFYPHDHR